jgi:nicotinic acid mononucleotide adenylyltransferase
MLKVCSRGGIVELFDSVGSVFLGAPILKNSTSHSDAHSESTQPDVCVLFGSSFDPPHFGHLGALLAAHQVARSQGLVPHFVLLTSPARWDKTQTFPDIARWQGTILLAKAAQNQGLSAEASRLELDWGLPYQGSYFTVDYWRQRQSNVVAFLCGKDSLRSLPEWRNGRTEESTGLKLSSDFPIWALNRPTPFEEPSGVQVQSVPSVTLDSSKKIPSLLTPGIHSLAGISEAIVTLKLLGLKFPLESLSSTQARELWSSGQSAEGLVLPGCEEFFLNR